MWLQTSNDILSNRRGSPTLAQAEFRILFEGKNSPFVNNMKTFDHRRPIRNKQGDKIGEHLSPTFRVTTRVLGGTFGLDSTRRLVVGLEPDDMISFRPEGTRQRIIAKAHELYQSLLVSRALRLQLERARQRKAKLALVRAQRRQQAADRRFKRSLA